jgi:hypothetical protein
LHPQPRPPSLAAAHLGLVRPDTRNNMKATVFLALMLVSRASLYAAPPVKLSDEQLRVKIAGVWFGEELLPQMRHIGQRTQYFPDGRFVCDCRLSTAGSEHYVRNVGTWKVSSRQFSETTTKCSDPVNIPTLVRHVVVMDRGHMILETDDGTRFEMWRGSFDFEKGRQSVSSVDRKKLFGELMAMNVSGYRLVPAGKGYSTIRIDTRKIPVAPPKKP